MLNHNWKSSSSLEYWRDEFFALQREISERRRRYWIAVVSFLLGVVSTLGWIYAR